MHAVHQAIEEIKKRRLKKVVLSRIMTAESSERLDPVNVLGRLHRRQPDCTLFAFERNSSIFLGATPEWLIKKSGGEVQTMCLAGTIKRGADEKEDRALENELLADEKNLAEHQFVVTRITEVMNTYCDEVECSSKPIIYKAGQVQHLCTPVTGKLKKGVSLLELVENLHPTPALGGLPKEEAVKAIRIYENYERGWYGAPIGWVDIEGNGAFAVAIRSGLIKGKQAVLFAGCGIVADSEPAREYEETKIKFKPMLDALGDVRR
ncbi:isochorismate synthase [Terrilactibacillus sp. S3-3]|nr:isochorismate synthase [Terrilactibacillus sp. S3-3]